MSEPTNEERATRAAEIIHAYWLRHDEGADEEEVLADLLADLRHYCDREDLNLYKALDMSYLHYTEEKAEAKARLKPRRKPRR